MNAELPGELEAELNRAMAPVVASPRRRRCMREELTGHLLSNYHSELARSPDSREAAEAVKRRFGDSVSIGRDLADSVPFLERITFGLLHQKERNMWRWPLIGILIFLFGITMILPALGKMKQHAQELGQRPDLMHNIAAGLMIGGIITWVGMALLGYGIRSFRRQAQ
jgi:hypothetical protein